MEANASRRPDGPETARVPCVLRPDLGVTTVNDCVFCAIVAGTIPSTVVAETDTALAFRDINPAAPVHVLVIPKRHVVDSPADLTVDHGPMLGELFELAAAVAELEHLESTYRVVTNSGADAGQSVFHLHFHVLGGWDRDLQTPAALADEQGG
jgi:histidine triad (HIT) family protein